MNEYQIHRISCCVNLVHFICVLFYYSFVRKTIDIVQTQKMFSCHTRVVLAAKGSGHLCASVHEKRAVFVYPESLHITVEIDYSTNCSASRAVFTLAVFTGEN